MAEIEELKSSVEQIKVEREFYFGKLREIEIFIQTQVDAGVDEKMETAFKGIQEIMYKTEDGFVQPDE